MHPPAPRPPIALTERNEPSLRVKRVNLTVWRVESRDSTRMKSRDSLIPTLVYLARKQVSTRARIARVARRSLRHR